MTTAPEDNIRQVIATPKTTAKPKTTPKSSVPTTPVNKNIPAPVDPNANRAVLGADQYPMAEITTTTGEKVKVYTGGPLAGQDKNGNTPIQASAPFIPGGGAGGNTGGGGNNAISGEMKDAYQRLFDEFNALGLGALVADSKDLLMKATSIAAIPDALRGTKAYMTRFSANDARIKAGLTALTPAEYLEKEDAYQKVMRDYGLPASYYTPGLYGKQEGFDSLIGNDVSALELEDRISTAQKRVINANPEVSAALKQFYPDITDGDILAYTLNPKNAIKDIQRKVTAAEIGGAALQQKGLTTSLARAEELQKYGVDKESATEGYSTIGAGLQRGSELAAIYKESPYTQATAESEIFKLTGQSEARKQRQKVTGLEKATFGGQTGVTSGALARDRAGGI
jgi:hypothetical protein